MVVDDNTIWIDSMSTNKEKYMISHWNVIHKAGIFKELDSTITGDFSTWDAYLVNINEQMRQFFSPYKTGWLNFEDYVYPWGRVPRSIESSKSLLNK